MYRRYYSYNDMPTLPNKEDHKSECTQIKPVTSPPAEDCEVHNQIKHQDNGLFGGLVTDGKIFGRFEIDDILLLVVIFVLLMDECDDNMLLLALGFIFITGII